MKWNEGYSRTHLTSLGLCAREKQRADMCERDTDPCINLNKNELGNRGAEFLIGVAWWSCHGTRQRKY